MPFSVGRFPRGAGILPASACRQDACTTARGMSLVEILVVIAIIGILVAAVGLIGRRVGQGGQVKLTRQYMQILTSAIDEFHGDTGNWPAPPNAPDKTAPDAGTPHYNPPDDLYLASAFATQPPRRLSSIEGMYAQLTWNPKSASILRRVPQAATASPDFRTQVMSPAGLWTDALLIIDAWRVPMRYRGYTYRNNGRPFLWSAGPDGRFATDPNRPEATGGQDDIFSDR